MDEQDLYSSDEARGRQVAARRALCDLADQDLWAAIRAAIEAATAAGHPGNVLLYLRRATWRPVADETLAALIKLGYQPAARPIHASQCVRDTPPGADFALLIAWEIV